MTGVHGNQILELAAASMDLEAASAVAEQLGGTLYADEREDFRRLPFRALVTAATDDLAALWEVGDVGVYVVFRRLVKPGIPGLIGLFPMVRHPDLSHAESDAHWRDTHGPLALEHHAAMTHYTQLSVVANLAGLRLDGFALCGFENEYDLRNRFYTGPESVDVIAKDVRQFADPGGSPARLLAREYRFAAEA